MGRGSFGRGGRAFRYPQVRQGATPRTPRRTGGGASAGAQRLGPFAQAGQPFRVDLGACDGTGTRDSVLKALGPRLDRRRLAGLDPGGHIGGQHLDRQEFRVGRAGDGWVLRGVELGELGAGPQRQAEQQEGGARHDAVVPQGRRNGKRRA
ncbi:hypothetical protein [Citreimonas sp.]|uniref:hypothetical protein n=1 Tax=Citreimonas sp. TaxID=3036715 RepID=UPI004058432B